MVPCRCRVHPLQVEKFDRQCQCNRWLVLSWGLEVGSSHWVQICMHKLQSCILRFELFEWDPVW